MSNAWIVVDAEVDATSPDVSALKQVMLSHSPAPITVRVVATDELGDASPEVPDDLLWCPLTLSLPDTLQFPAQDVYQACRDVSGRRQWVEQHLGYATGAGHFWLPVVFTAKGPLYGEAIGIDPTQASPELRGEVLPFNPGYQQPVDLSDVWRQPLYHLGYELLHSLSAPPATYLLQFGFEGQQIIFDRLWPFPAAPALASINSQKPDLYTCHWYCLIGKPIVDLTIIPTSS